MTERNVAAVRAAQTDQEAYIRKVSGGASSPSDEIARAKALLDSGAISNEEFNQLKNKALMTSAGPSS
jgi:multidrug resistance efflux pump